MEVGGEGDYIPIANTVITRMIPALRYIIYIDRFYIALYLHS